MKNLYFRMKKAIMAVCGILMAVLLLSGLQASLVYALENVKFTNDYNRDIKIIMQYEGSEPNFTVTDPEGKSYAGKDAFNQFEQGSTTLYLYLKDAPQGDWQVQADKKVDITVMDWKQQLTVENLL